MRVTVARPPGAGAGGDRRDTAALVLAAGLAAALNVIVFAVLYDAIFSNDSGLSENATQILTGWGGGILGILGSWIGYRAGAAASAVPKPESPEREAEL